MTTTGGARSWAYQDMGVRALALTLLLVLSAPCLAQEHVGFGHVPSDAVAWWRIDPTLEGAPAGEAQQSLIEGALRAVLASGFVHEGDAVEGVTGILIASVLGASAHQFVLLDLAQDDAGTNGAERLGGFKGVLEVRGRDDHQALVRTMQSMLVDAGADAGSQRPIKLGVGHEGVAYRRDAWPAWMEVSWTSTPDAFFVGIGQDALTEWFNPAFDDAEPMWAAHERAIEANGGGEPVFELFVDFNRIRRTAPDWFGRGRMGRLLSAWSLSNARLFMLHGRLKPAAVVKGGPSGPYQGPPLLVVEASWESRSDMPGTVRHAALTAKDWPHADLAMEAPEGRFVMVAPTHVVPWIDRAVATYGAINREPRASEFVERARGWARQSQNRVRRLERASAPFVVVSDAAPAGLWPPMLATLHLEVDPGIRLESYEAELGRVMATLGEQVVYDEPTRTWSVRVLPEQADPDGSLCVLAWGLARGKRPVLVVGWSRAGVLEARRALEE